MPKLPVVSGRDVIRVLEKLGFTIMRQRGSHVVLRKGTVGCVVPNYPEIKTGTLAGILKQAGVLPKEFVGHYAHDTTCI